MVHDFETIRVNSSETLNYSEEDIHDTTSRYVDACLKEFRGSRMGTSGSLTTLKGEGKNPLNLTSSRYSEFSRVRSAAHPTEGGGGGRPNPNREFFTQSGRHLPSKCDPRSGCDPAGRISSIPRTGSAPGRTTPLYHTAWIISNGPSEFGPVAVPGCLKVGGRWANGATCGLSAFNSNNDLTNSNENNGARLAYPSETSSHKKQLTVGTDRAPWQNIKTNNNHSFGSSASEYGLAKNGSRLIGPTGGIRL